MNAKNTLKIEIPAGFEIDSFDQATGEIKFKQKPANIIDRIKSIDDALLLLSSNDEDVIIYKKLISVLNENSYPVSQQAAVILTKAFNEGWLPDWNNTSQPKYFPYFEMGGSSGFRFYDCADWLSCSSVGSRLALKSSDLATHLGKQFTPIYKRFMII